MVRKCSAPSCSLHMLSYITFDMYYKYGTFVLPKAGKFASDWNKSEHEQLLSLTATGGISNRCDLQLHYDIQHQSFFTISYLYVQDNSATLMENKFLPSRVSLLPTHRQTHIHSKTCYKFFNEVKTATNSECPISPFSGQRFPACPIASNGLCNRHRWLLNPRN